MIYLVIALLVLWLATGGLLGAYAVQLQHRLDKQAVEQEVAQVSRRVREIEESRDSTRRRLRHVLTSQGPPGSLTPEQRREGYVPIVNGVRQRAAAPDS